jgi:NTE family protein
MTNNPSPTAGTGPSETTAASDKPADLVLEGGRVKGIGLVGAILTLDEAGYTFKRVAGTSAGAIGAALVAALDRARQPLSKVDTYLKTIDYPRFMQRSPLRRMLGAAGDAEQLLFHMGLFDGDYLVEWLGGVLSDIGVTHFGDLALDDPDADKNLSADQRFTLVVHTSDISRGKCVRLPWEYREYGLDPSKQRIVDAVRASMSIPFFFRPVQFRATTAVVDGTTFQAGPVTWVDGGLLDNFPVDVFDRTDGVAARWPTIGIKLSARETTISSGETDSTIDEAISCLRTLLDNAERYYVSPDSAARTIFVDNCGIKATDFALTDTDQQRLFDSGTQAAKAWLAAQK